MAAKRGRTDESNGAGAGAGGAAGGAGGEGPVKLYSYWRSSCSWRVRIALAWKGIDYEYAAVHLLNEGGEQLKEAYAAKHPMKELPLLAIDDTEIAHSAAIVYYLEETRQNEGQGPLLPALGGKGAALRRARIRQVIDIIGSDIQPVQNLRVLKHVMAREADKEAKEAAKMAWGHKWISNGFDGLEKLLATTAGTYCVGDEVTMADLWLPPQVYNAERFGVDMSAYPTISRVNAALAELPAFKAAHPSVCPDAVK